MKRNWRLLGCMLIISLFLVLSGCACFQETAVKETPAPVAEKPVDPAVAEKPAVKPVDEEAKKLALQEKLIAEAHAFADQNVHFAFDRYDLDSEARANLNHLGAWLRRNKNFDVIIEGHCDERGTAEYNLALGERRASAAEDYLVNLGVDTERLTTVSYGEERPLDPRSNEEAWAKNRRAHFNVFPTTWEK